MPDATAPLRFEYAREPNVSAELDRKLRELISSCFDQPHGRGHFRGLLADAHEDLAQQGLEYTVLLGEPAVYASSGYRPLDVSICRFDPETQSFEHGVLAVALHKTLTEKPWPAGPVDLRGPLF